jgi:glutathione synthase/RimK-type ligase-like ATP-grasp enzyme
MPQHIKLWIEACKELNIAWEVIDEGGNFLRITKNQQYYFCGAFTPFNLHVIGKIFDDKGYTYELLKNKINMPKTLAFVAGDGQEKNLGYVKEKDIESICQTIKNNLTLPVIVKRNTGTQGNNVFFCKDTEAVKSSLEAIFNVNSKDYDKVALAQKYIEIEREYRAVFFNNQLILLYEKSKAEAEFIGNLSPLHWEGSKAVHITDSKILSKIQKFIEPIVPILPLNYVGADIALDKQGNFWLIELNGRPIFNGFIKNNNPQIIIEMFKIMLQTLN